MSASTMLRETLLIILITLSFAYVVLQFYEVYSITLVTPNTEKLQQALREQQANLNAIIIKS